MSVFELGGVPVNKNTAMAISGGTNYETSKNITELIFKERPIIPDFPENKTVQFVENLAHHINLRRGRLVIVAWFGSHQKCGTKWLCRCDCGYYVTRGRRSFKPEKINKFDACPYCYDLVFLKRNEYWRRTGISKDIEYFA